MRQVAPVTVRAIAQPDPLPTASPESLLGCPCAGQSASSRCLWCAPSYEIATSDRLTEGPTGQTWTSPGADVNQSLRSIPGPVMEAEDGSIADLRRCMASLDLAMGAFNRSAARSGEPSLVWCTGRQRFPIRRKNTQMHTPGIHAHARPNACALNPHTLHHVDTQARARAHYKPYQLARPSP
jgi:hypothetical protein